LRFLDQVCAAAAAADVAGHRRAPTLPYIVCHQPTTTTAAASRVNRSRPSLSITHTYTQQQHQQKQKFLQLNNAKENLITIISEKRERDKTKKDRDGRPRLKQNSTATKKYRDDNNASVGRCEVSGKCFLALRFLPFLLFFQETEHVWIVQLLQRAE